MCFKMYNLPEVEEALASPSGSSLFTLSSSKLLPGCKLCSTTGGFEAGLHVCPNILSSVSKCFVVTLFHPDFPLWFFVFL